MWTEDGHNGSLKGYQEMEGSQWGMKAESKDGIKEASL